MNKFASLTLLATLGSALAFASGDIRRHQQASWGCQWICTSYAVNNQPYVRWSQWVNRCQENETCQPPQLACTYSNIGVARPTPCEQQSENE